MRPGIYNIAKKAVILVAVLPCLFDGPNAFAAKATNTMNIKAQVNGACVLSVADMNFGTVTQVTGTETASSYVTVVCSRGATVDLTFVSNALGNTTRNSTLVSPAGGTINFSMALQGSHGTLFAGQTGFTFINGKLFATPGAAAGVYSSVETLYVIY